MTKHQTNPKAREALKAAKANHEPEKQSAIGSADKGNAQTSRYDGAILDAQT